MPFLLNNKMAAMSFNTKEKTPIFTTASETATTTTESYNFNESRSGAGHVEGIFAPMTPPMQGQRGNSDLINLLSQHEPLPGDTAPDFVDEMFTNMRVSGSDIIYEELEQQNNNTNPNSYFAGTGAVRPEYDNPNIWGDSNSSGSGNCSSQTSSTERNAEMLDTFDFLVKSLSSANQYVSMLTREQLSVLRSIRPILLYELLVEVAKIRNEKRMRRALPNECAFCKNNGENEESYSSHALKDWRGRVLCPVLRAFRCPRCGATGDRAHTIKYCPENDEGLERSGNYGGRRRSTPSTSLLFGAGSPLMTGSHPNAPVTSPAPATATMSQSSIWNPFGIN